MVTVQGMNGTNSVLTSECPSSSSRRAEESTSIGDETAKNGRQPPRHASGRSVVPRRRHPPCWAAVAVALLIINAIVHLADAQPCPNSCNGHGRCSNPDRTCYCFTGYLGPDCSRLSCPYGAAWVDLAAGNDNAHNAAECSNMGLCDRSTGTCTCRTGFGGKVCPPCCPDVLGCLDAHLTGLFSLHTTGVRADDVPGHDLAVQRRGRVPVHAVLRTDEGGRLVSSAVARLPALPAAVALCHLPYALHGRGITTVCSFTALNVVFACLSA